MFEVTSFEQIKLEQIIQKIPFLRISVFLITGIIAQNLLNIPILPLLILNFVLFAFLVMLNKTYKHASSHFFGLALFLNIFFAGYIISALNNKKPQFFKDCIYYATILEVPEEKTNSLKTIIQVKYINKNDSILKSNEKIIAYFNTTFPEKIFPGQQVIFENTPQEIKNRNNPFEFDYQKYINRKKIYRQVYLSDNTFVFCRYKPFKSLKIIAEQLRHTLLNRYKNAHFGENEFQIISALTLGYKRGLDPEIKRIFSAAGAMHVLAVSGLHVGIIFMLVSFVFVFLRKSKSGKYIFICVSIFCLWTYALLTGFSPSVQRAATMFSFIVIGQNLKKQTSIYNSLAASAFLLLLLNPNNLFEVGFQLSYSAVFGIVFMQPKFEKIYHPRFLIIRYLWSLLTVSVAAQIATFPLAVFYFNQIPTYFWLTNLILIPAVILLIPSGIIFLVLSDISFANNLLGDLIQYTLSGLYRILNFIEQLPQSTIQFSFSGVELFVFILFLLNVFVFMEFKKITNLRWALFALIMFFSIKLTTNLNTIKSSKIIVYNTGNQAVVHLIRGKNNYLISEASLSKNDFEFSAVANTIVKLKLDSCVVLKTTDKFQDKNLLVNNKLLFFDGKWLAVNLTETKTPHPKLDFAINCYSCISAKNNILTYHKTFPQTIKTSTQIYYTEINGAFYFKW